MVQKIDLDWYVPESGLKKNNHFVDQHFFPLHMNFFPKILILAFQAALNCPTTLKFFHVLAKIKAQINISKVFFLEQTKICLDKKDSGWSAG